MTSVQRRQSGCHTGFLASPGLGPPELLPRPPRPLVRRCARPGPRSWAAERAAGCVPGPPPALPCRCGPSLTSIWRGRPHGAVPMLDSPALAPPRCTAALRPPTAQNTAGQALHVLVPVVLAPRKGCLWLNVEWVSALNWQTVLPHMPKPRQDTPSCRAEGAAGLMPVP